MRKPAQIEKARPRDVIAYHPPSSAERIVYVERQYLPVHSTPSPKFALPLLILTIAFGLFLLAYAGPAIGNTLGYLIIPAFGIFPGLLVGERFGKVAGFLAGFLLVAVLGPVYGTTLISNSISLFTSLQKISQGVLVFLAGLSTLSGLLLLLVSMKQKRG